MSSFSADDVLLPLPPGWPPGVVTPVGEEAVRLRLTIRERGWSFEDAASALGVSVARVRCRFNRSTLILRRIANRDVRHCVECGTALPVDARPDATFCLSPSSCRARRYKATGTHVRSRLALSVDTATTEG